GPQPHLVDRLLAGDIGGGAALAGERGRDLQQQRRFADAGIAPDQDRRAGDEAAAADAVDLADPGLAPRRALGRAAQPDEIERPTATPTSAAGTEPLAEPFRGDRARHLL